MVGSLTRVRNNQVYNSDIYASAKLVAKSVTGGLLSDNFTYAGNMTIGNLTVNGNTTTLDTTNLVVADPLLAINRNQSGTPTYDLGFVMGRGNQTNVAMIWEEGAQQFQLQYTSESTASTTYGIINNSGFANLQAYGILLNNATVGTLTVTSSSQAPSYTTTNGGQFTGYFTGAIGANTPNSGVFTTASTSGNLTVGGNLTVTGNINAITANVYTQGGIFYGAPTTGFNALYAGQTGFTPLAQTLIQISGNYNGFVQVNEQNTNNGTSASTDFIATANNGSDNDTYIDFGINSSGYQNATYGLQAANDGYLYVAGNSSTGGGNLVISTTTANDIIYSLGGIATANEFARMRANTNSFVISSTTNATNTTTGALQVRGGIGTNGNIYAAAIQNTPIGNGTASTGAFTTLSTTSTITAQGTVSAPTVQAGTIGNSGAQIYGANIAITGNALIQNGLALNSNATLTTDQATVTLFNLSSTTINMGGAATAINLGKADGTSAVKVNGTANSYGSGQGALQIGGGFYAGGDSYINGNLSITGNLTTVGYNELIANAPLLYLSVGSISTYNYELGFYSHKYDAVEGYNHTGFVRNHLDNSWYVFSNIRAEPGLTVDLANANIVYDTVKLGNIIAYSGNTSTSTTTGAAVIYGGMGVGGNIYAAAIQNTPIGNGIASTGAFTTLTTSSTIVSQGTITGAGQIVGYFNGAIGANTANSGNFTTVVTTSNIYAGGNIIAASGTGSTSTTTGALVVQGGVGVSGNIYLGSNVFAGSPSYSDVNIKYSGSLNVNNYIQSILQNTNNGTSASSDFIVNNDQSTATTYYGDFGMNSSGFSGTGSLSAPNNVYLTSTSSDLVLGTTTSNAIRFVINGGATDAAIVATNGNIVVQTTTTSISNTTGALVVNGGVGVVGNIYSGANITAVTAVIAPNMYNSNIYPASGSDLYKNTGVNGNLWINYNGYNANVIVNGSTASGYSNLFVVNGYTGQVGIKKLFNAFIGNASFQIGSTDSMIVPVGTTGQRPSNGTAGMVRYNSLTNQLEFYNAGSSTWSGTGSTFTIVSEDTFTGNGSQVNFTLSQSGTTNSTIVAINGVIQLPLTAYSVSGTTLTFTEAPLSTDVIDARVITTTAIATALSAGTSAFEVTDTGGTTGNIHGYVNGSTYRWIANAGTSGSNYFGGGQAPLMSNVALTQNTPTAIDSFSTSAFRGAKYVIKVTDGTNNRYSMAEVIVVHDGTTPTSQIYGVVNTGANALANFSTSISSGIVYMNANTWSSTASATMFPTYMPV